MIEDEGERSRSGKPKPTRSEPDPVSVPENGDFRYDQANEAPGAREDEAETRRPREA